MFNKKQQLFYADGKGNFTFVDFSFSYTTSVQSFNHKEEKNLAYVCVVDNNNLNLTPLGRFVMPPPMFEKQIKLSSFPLKVDMYGHWLAAVCADGSILVANCMDHQNAKILKDVDGLDQNEMTKLLFFKTTPKDKEFKIVVVLNMKQNQNEDKLIMYTLDEGMT